MVQPQPTAHEMARRAQEVFHQNIDTLVAGFLIRHPEIDPSTVRINMQATTDGMSAFVTPVQIPIPEAKEVPGTVGPVTMFDAAGEQAFCLGWNACRDALIASLQALGIPPLENDHE